MATINGTSGSNSLSGTSAADIIHGLGGNDTLFGLAGDDQLYGDAGDDVLRGSAGNDRIEGGTGFDFANYYDQSAAVTVSLAITGAQATGAAGRDTLVGIEGLYGGAGSDTLRGSTSANTLHGYGGNDTLEAGGGNDTLRGGIGNDHLDGGSGDDLVYGEAGDDRVDGGTGRDTASFAAAAGSVSIVAFANYGEQVVATGADGRDELVSIERLRGSLHADRIAMTGWSGETDRVPLEVFGLGGSDTIIGSGQADRLQGNDGNDAVRGADGADRVSGNAGHDQLAGGWGDDVMVGGAGVDRFVWDGLVLGPSSETSFYHPWSEAPDMADADADVVVDFVRGTDKLQIAYSRVTGTDPLGQPFYALDDGDALFARLDSSRNGQLDDADAAVAVRSVTVDGVARISTVIELGSVSGGRDALTLFGVTGLTAADVDSVYARVSGTTGNDTRSGSASADLIRGLAGNDVLDGLAGDDAILGGTGADTLRGGRGDDRMHGGDGSDLFYGGTGENLIDGGNGRDTVSYADATGGVGVDLEYFNAPNAVHNDGTDVLVSIERVRGSQFDDWMSGTTIAFIGFEAPFALDLFGLGGDDGIVGGGSGDRIEGNDGDDGLSGMSGSDRLDDGAGNDELAGGFGNDVLVGGSGADRFRYNASTYWDGDGNEDNADIGHHVVADFVRGTDTLRLRYGSTDDNFEYDGDVLVDLLDTNRNGVLDDLDANVAITNAVFEGVTRRSTVISFPPDSWGFTDRTLTVFGVTGLTAADVEPVGW